MLTSITFGYRGEGLALHQWAKEHTHLKAVVLPSNRLEGSVSGSILDWVDTVGVPLLIQEGKDDPHLVGSLLALKPNIIICCCYSYILTKEILSIPDKGCINIHPGDYERYKGRRPIEASMVNGEGLLWASLHYMGEGLDTGPLISTGYVESSKDLEVNRRRLTMKGLELLGGFLCGTT